MSYPNNPGFKGTIETGREAAFAFGPKVAGRRAEVLEHLRTHGSATAEDIASATDRHWYTVRPRISELKEMGLVVDTGDRRQTQLGGKTAVVRAATPEEFAAFVASRDHQEAA